VRSGNSLKVELCGLVLLVGIIGIVRAEDAKPSFPVMAPIPQYLEATASAEIALARTAAPPSISGDASVLVLGKHGYETAAEGKNGVVCLVWRAWSAGPGATGDDDRDFWNPKLRIPICYNPAGARSVLPAYLESTKWAFAGASKADIKERTRVQLASHQMAAPESGSMAFMMGRAGGFADGHHWPPHIMLFFPPISSADWGAGLHGVPISADQEEPEPNITTFNVLVPMYSDGTPAPVKQH